MSGTLVYTPQQFEALPGNLLIGGGYRASQAADGSWTIHDVPIFGEVPKHERGNKQDIGRPWMEQAIQKARARLDSDKYLAPLHVGHHDIFGQTERAGFILPNAVREIQYEGRAMHALFADLSGIPDHLYRRVRGGELPYRSVEIHDYDRPEIASLALMADEVPFFRFPMLTIGDEQSSIEFARRDQSSPFRAVRLAKSGGAFLFRFNGGYSMDPTKPAAPGAPAPETKKPEAAPAADGSGVDAKLDKLCALVEGLVKFMTATAPKPAGQESGTPAEVDKMRADADVKVQMAALSGQVAGLKSEIEERKKGEEKDALRKFFEKELRGYHIGAADRKTVESYLAEANAKKLVETFVENVKATRTPLPAATLDDIGSDPIANAAALPKELAKFAENPDTAKAAAKAAMQFADLEKAGMAGDLTLEEFVGSQVKSAAARARYIASNGGK